MRCTHEVAPLSYAMWGPPALPASQPRPELSRTTMPAPRSEIVPGWGPVATGPVRLAAPPGSLRGHDLESAYREKLSGNSCALAAAAGGNRHVATLVRMQFSTSADPSPDHEWRTIPTYPTTPSCASATRTTAVPDRSGCARNPYSV